MSENRYLTAALKLRAAMNKAGLYLTDEQAINVPLIFPVWSPTETYVKDERVVIKSSFIVAFKHTLHKRLGLQQTRPAYGLRC